MLDCVPILDKGSEFESGCNYLDTYLSANTFLVGYDVSIADIALWAALAGRDINILVNLYCAFFFKFLMCFYAYLSDYAIFILAQWHSCS